MKNLMYNKGKQNVSDFALMITKPTPANGGSLNWAISKIVGPVVAGGE